MWFKLSFPDDEAEAYSVIEALAYAIFKPTDNTSDTNVVIRSEGVTHQSAERWREVATFKPEPGQTAYGLFNLDATYQILARTTFQEDNTPLILLARVTREQVRALHGNLRPLLRALPTPTLDQETPPPLAISALSGWSPSEHAETLQTLLTKVEQQATVLALLNAAVTRERLLIYNAPLSTAERVAVITGLMALLPRCARSDLTFATHIDEPTPNGRIVFAAKRQADTVRHQFNWETQTFATDQPIPRSPYIAILDEVIADSTTLLQVVTEFDPLADCATAADLIPRLGAMAERYTFHQGVQGHTAPAAADLKDALSDPTHTIPNDWRSQYARMLLPMALEAKDTDAHSLIAHQMDVDPALDEALTAQLAALTPDMPDLIYVFNRQRLSEGIDPRWQGRLYEAAAQSLQVALDSQDPDLILSWLRLLAREPDSFGLGDLLTNGVIQALPLAYQDDTFALNLLTLVARFIPNSLDSLLDDDQLLNALPAEVRDAFAIYERDALLELQNHSTSLFLAGVGRAAQARQGAPFQAGLIERIWALYNSEKKVKPRSSYTPEYILAICAESGANWLPSVALETLLGLLLTQPENDLYKTFTAHLAKHDLLIEHLPGALLWAGRDVNTMMDTVTALTSAGKLTPFAVIDVYLHILNALAWDANPMMDAVARALTQHPNLTISEANLRTMLERAATIKAELPARAASLALLERGMRVEDDEALVDLLGYVFSQLTWSAAARTAALGWWRVFIDKQPTARLSRLDALMVEKRVLESPLGVLRSGIAMRRLISGGEVGDFINSINNAYNTLEVLAEAFEPSEKGGDISFEPETIKAALTQIGETLTPQQRQILSNSLKGIAGLIARMGDNRTKAGITRRSDSVDRQLITGEQMPTGAVDVMKWMAGYFSGAQSTDNDDEQ